MNDDSLFILLFPFLKFCSNIFWKCFLYSNSSLLFFVDLTMNGLRKSLETYFKSRNENDYKIFYERLRTIYENEDEDIKRIPMAFMAEWAGYKFTMMKRSIIDIYENGQISTEFLCLSLQIILKKHNFKIAQMRAVSLDGHIVVDICAGVFFASKDGVEYNYQNVYAGSQELYYYKNGSEMLLLPKGHVPLFILCKNDSPL